MAKKRVALTLDEDIFRQFQQAIMDSGYPRSYVSIVVQNFMRRYPSTVYHPPIIHRGNK